MRRLILMRHAKSSWNTPSRTDFDRPLNNRGYVSATALGKWLRLQHFHPDVAVVSSARRTGETFEGLELDTPVQFTRTLYHASAEEMREALREQIENTVLMIGHNPGIAACARRLVATPPHHDRFADYPTGATLVADFQVESWNDLQWKSGTTIDFVVPRELV